MELHVRSLGYSKRLYLDQQPEIYVVISFQEAQIADLRYRRLEVSFSESCHLLSQRLF